MIKQFIYKLFRNSGYEIKKIDEIFENARGSKQFDGFDLQKEGEDAINFTANYSMMPYMNLYTLYEQAAYCEKNNIEGDFVECGVWKGGAVGIMALANLRYGKKRRNLHLFDAFDDICAPNIEVDGKRAMEDVTKHSSINNQDELQGQLQPIKGIYDFVGGHGTEEICKELLIEKIKYPTQNIIFHKGWFQETVPIKKHDIDKIAILRLDGDWYESIKVCLENLYDKVQKGGLIVIDDYGYYEGCTKAVDEFLEVNNIKTFLSYSTVGCRYFVKS